MKEGMYQSMYETETYHWYFKSKYEIVLAVLENAGLRKHSEVDIGDFGCGCGLMLEKLALYGKPVGMDFSDEALQYCRLNFSGELVQVDVEKYDEKDKFDYCIALDVIEHVKNDSLALKNINNSLRDDGVCVITVPAFMCLWSKHDENCMHYRRYDKKKLESCVANGGFDIKYISYYNFWSFIPVFLVRKLENLFHLKNSGSRLEYGFKKDGFVNNVLYHIFSSEKKRIIKDKTYPFGVGLICLAKKGEKRSEELF